MRIKLKNDLRFLAPVNVEMIRYGRNNDGGYVIPYIATLCSNGLISLGVGSDWSFEEDWNKIHNDQLIHCYDGTIDFDQYSEEIKNSYYTFFKNSAVHIYKNIGNRVNEVTIEQAIEDIKCHDIFLKMDIEGNEYALIPNIISNYNFITGLAIEFHGIRDNRQLFLNSVIELQKQYEVAHFHGNNWGDLCFDGFPDVVEMTFLRKDLCNTTERRLEIYLENIDTPNFTFREEYYFYFE